MAQSDEEKSRLRCGDKRAWQGWNPGTESQLKMVSEQSG